MKKIVAAPHHGAIRMLPSLTLALALGLSGCTSAEKEISPLVSVTVTPAQKTAVSQTVSADAVIFPLRQATVSPKITSTISDFKVQRGSLVKRGQLLAVLENKDLSAQAEASKGDLDQADANYVIAVNSGLPQQIQKAELDGEASKSAFDAAQKIYASRKDLFQQGAIPRRDLDTAEVALAQARSQNEQARKQLADLQRIGKEQLMKAAHGTKESAEGHYRAATAQLSYSEIRSPIDGVITERPLYIGDLAMANQPLLIIMDTSSLVAKAHVPQSEAALLKAGDAASIKVPTVELEVKGRVSLVSPALDPGSSTVEVWVEVRKPDPALRPGMSARIEMNARTLRDVIAVPTGSVFKNPDGAYYVLVAGPDQKAHQKLVQLGLKGAGLTQITSGLKEGDPVITSGGYAIPEGTAIQIEKPSGGEKDDSEISSPKSDPPGKDAPASTAKEKE
jgi:HlyD family secretion protein